jgi:hypothetical protein
MNKEVVNENYSKKDLLKTQLSLTIYEMEGCDKKVAIVSDNSKGCNLFYLNKGKYTFLSGLSNKDGSDITEKDILLHVTLFFELEYAIPNKNTVNKAVVKGFG